MLSDELRKLTAAEIRRGTALREIARKTGISAGNLSKFLSGERPPSGGQFDLLAEYLRLKLVKK